MSELKEKILAIMEKNSKVGVADLAVLLGDTEENVSRAIYEMEQDKIICGYHTLINWNKVNNEKVIAMIEVRVTPQRGQGFDRIAERIYQYPEVKSVNLMSGSYDFGITVEGANIKEISLFVSQHLAPMESVLGTATHFVLKRYKFDGVICANPESDDREVISL